LIERDFIEFQCALANSIYDDFPVSILGAQDMADQGPHDNRVYDRRVRAAERAHDSNREHSKLLSEAATRDAQGAIRVLLGINGGAAIALLAFSGGLVARSSIGLSKIGEIISNLVWFVWGVITAAIAAALAYLTNFSYATATELRSLTWEHPFIQETQATVRWRKTGRVFHLIGIIAAISSLILFALGMFRLHAAIISII
jgi:hypothetical protein